MIALGNLLVSQYLLLTFTPRGFSFSVSVTTLLEYEPVPLAPPTWGEAGAAPRVVQSHAPTGFQEGFPSLAEDEG